MEYVVPKVLLGLILGALGGLLLSCLSRYIGSS